MPLFQNESKCETFYMKMSSACSFIFIQIKVIFIRMVSHSDPFGNRGTRELENDLLHTVERTVTRQTHFLKSIVMRGALLWRDNRSEIGKP